MNFRPPQLLQHPVRYRGLVWAVYLFALLGAALAIWDQYQDIESNTQRLARERGSVLFRLIELTREWNALHGGVYVPVTDNTQPNPYLKSPKRDIVDQEGRRLTMVNPAFMTRQIAELASRAEGIRFHITSLKPIRPANAADDWEQESLGLFEKQGLKERLSFFADGGGLFTEPTHRYMAPLIVKQACLKCHESQGYKVGDIRGGISVSMPTADLLELAKKNKKHAFTLYGSVFLILAALLHLLLHLARRSFASLQEAETRYRTVADFTYDWETWIGPDKRWIHCSPSCLPITGYPAQAFLDRPKLFLEIIHPDDRAWVEEHIESIDHNNTDAHVFQFRIQHRDGHEVWLEHACQPVFDPERGYLGRRASNRDISARKQAELALAEAKDAAETANRAKSTFLSNVSHEVRTPLHQIAGMAQLLRMDSLTPKQQDRLNKLETACTHLTVLMNAILELSRLESEDFDLQMEPFYVDDLLQEVSEVLLEPAASKNLLLLTTPAPVHEQLRGDRNRLRMALLHYLTNAIRFTEVGSVELRVEVESQYPDAYLLRFEVEDSGIGVAPQDMARLFTTFEQADNSTTRRYSGLGLGLATTRKIAEKMGGQAGCVSTPSLGSTFWFTARLQRLTQA